MTFNIVFTQYFLQLLDATIRYFIMTTILLNSRGFVIEVIFFHILPFSYRDKNVRRRKMTKFG